MSEIKCPKCGSTNIGQYRMPTGAIWCGDCGFRVEQKETGNPFIVEPPKPVHVQIADHPMSAMPLAKYLNQISQNETPFEECSAKVQRAYLDKATFILGFLQPAFAAQRQAGREEREGELKAMHDAWCDDMKERYTAVVEAARWIADEDITETERIIIGMDKIRKALDDLGEAKGGK